MNAQMETVIISPELNREFVCNGENSPINFVVAYEMLCDVLNPVEFEQLMDGEEIVIDAIVLVDEDGTIDLQTEFSGSAGNSISNDPEYDEYLRLKAKFESGRVWTSEEIWEFRMLHGYDPRDEGDMQCKEDW